jgi:hypothetical protein
MSNSGIPLQSAQNPAPDEDMLAMLGLHPAQMKLAQGLASGAIHPQQVLDAASAAKPDPAGIPPDIARPSETANTPSISAASPSATSPTPSIATPSIARPSGIPPLIARPADQREDQMAAQPAPSVPATSAASAPPPPSLSGMGASPRIAPALPQNVTSPTRLSNDQGELERVERTGSGLQQFQQRHPVLGTIARIGAGLGSALFPSIAMAIPGTDLHHQLLLNQDRAAVNQDLAEQKDEGQIAEAGARTNLTQAQADAAKNPKTGLTPEETTIHDLMTGQNGQPRVNPQTQKPYTYLEAYTAMNEAKEGAKPVKPEKPDTPEQQFIDDYQKKNQGASIADAVKAYALATTRPEKGGTADARADRSYTYNNNKLDTLAKPIEDAEARMGRLRESLAQGTPQADALVAPELLTIMAGGAGSGLRMNEAEISRIVGGRSKWQSLEASINQWSTDPTKANSITPEQRQQIRDLTEAVNAKLQKKQQALDQARENLLNSDDPKEHRKIVTDAHHALTQVDETQPGGNQAGHIIKLNGSRYQYSGTGDTADLKNYTKLP